MWRVVFGTWMHTEIGPGGVSAMTIKVVLPTLITFDKPSKDGKSIAGNYGGDSYI